MNRNDDLRVYDGPRTYKGRHLVRIVGRPGAARAETEKWVEIWTGQNWSGDAIGLPTVHEVGELPASPGEMLDAYGVPPEPFPKGYRRPYTEERDTPSPGPPRPEDPRPPLRT